MTIKTKITVFVLLVAGVFLWALSLFSMNELKLSSSLATANQIAPITNKFANEKRELENTEDFPISFAVWKQSEMGDLKGLSTSRTSNVSVLEINGDSRLILNHSAVLSGEDTSGCLIDAATATELFGSSNAKEEIVTYLDKDYTVRGIIPSPNKTFVIAADKESQLNNVSFDTSLDRDNSFLSRLGFSPVLNIKTQYFYNICKIINAIPAILMLIILIAQVIKGLRSSKMQPIKNILLIATLWASITAFVLVFLTLVPISLLPTYWSDFGYWSNTGASLKNNFVTYLSIPKTKVDILNLTHLLKSFTSIISATLFAVAWNICSTHLKIKALSNAY